MTQGNWRAEFQEIGNQERASDAMCDKISGLFCGPELANCQEQPEPSTRVGALVHHQARLCLSHLPTALPGSVFCVAVHFGCAVLHTSRSLQTQDSCIEARSISFAAIVRSVYILIASLVKKLAASAFGAALSCYL